MENPLPEHTWARIGIYVLYSLVVFLIAFALTFPDGQLTEIAEVQLESAIEKSQQTDYTVRVGDVDPWWLGVELEDVRVETASPPEDGNGGTTENGDPPEDSGGNGGGKAQTSPGFSISTTSIGARLAPIGSLLQGGLAIQYHLGIGGGSLSGLYVRGSSSQSVTLAVDQVDLRESRLMSKFTGVPAFGKLNGQANVQLEAKRPIITGGSITLRGSQVTIGPKDEVKIPGIPLANLSIPQTNFGNLKADMHFEKKKGQPPKLMIDQFQTEGRDLKTQVWEHVRLADTLGAAQAKLKMRINFNPDFIQNNELTPLLQQDKFRNGRSGDWYGFVLWGPLNSANFDGSTTAAKGPKGDEGGSDGQKGGNAKEKKSN